MLERLGFKHFAYDWRGRAHPDLRRRGRGPEAARRRARRLLGRARRAEPRIADHPRLAQAARRSRPSSGSCSTSAPIRSQGAEQERRVEAAAAKLRPLAEEAGKIGCSLALYNHGGWFGEPENQIAIIERLEGAGRHATSAWSTTCTTATTTSTASRACSAKMKPYLMALNLNGMDPGGDRVGRKILPLGQGSRDLELLRIDPRQRLSRADRHPRPHDGRRRGAAQGQPRRPRLAGASARRASPPGPRPRPRTPVPPPRPRSRRPRPPPRLPLDRGTV